MKVLAVAKRNKNYRWSYTFEKCKIEAVFENDHITFLEYYNNHVNTLTEETVKALFHREGEIITKKDLPFMIEENIDFYTILNRKQEQYKEKFRKIINSSKRTLKRIS
jgi:hypothetical protein